MLTANKVVSFAALDIADFRAWAAENEVDFTLLRSMQALDSLIDYDTMRISEADIVEVMLTWGDFIESHRDAEPGESLAQRRPRAFSGADV